MLQDILCKELHDTEQGQRQGHLEIKSVLKGLADLRHLILPPASGNNDLHSNSETPRQHYGGKIKNTPDGASPQSNGPDTS